MHYPGNYDQFRRLRAEAREARKAAAKVSAAPAAASASSEAKPSQRPGARKKVLSGSEERELTALPDRIDEAEQLISSLLGKLGDPSTYASGGDVTALNRELEYGERAAAERLTGALGRARSKTQLYLSSSSSTSNSNVAFGGITPPAPAAP